MLFLRATASAWFLPCSSTCCFFLLLEYGRWVGVSGWVRRSGDKVKGWMGDLDFTGVGMQSTFLRNLVLFIPLFRYTFLLGWAGVRIFSICLNDQISCEFACGLWLCFQWFYLTVFFFESPGTFSTLAGHSRAEILAKRFLAFLHFPF